MHVNRSGPPSDAKQVILVLPGGRANSLAPSPRGLAYLRMVPFSWIVRGPDVAVWMLRYRYRGWNEPFQHPVADVRRALGEAARVHPNAPITMIGHSMGGRAALRAADEPQVEGVCALAPWIDEGEPHEHLAGKRLLLAHGTNDRVTDPRLSAWFADVTGARFVPVPGDTHAMLHHPRTWNTLVKDFV